MLKLLFPVFFIVISTLNLFGQKAKKEFEVFLPEKNIQNSLYNKLSYIDSRSDTSNMGIVQVGAFNRKAKVITETPFSIQLENLMNALIDSTAKNGELLFQLRQLSFAEVTGALSEKGYCFIRAELYSKKSINYFRLSSIDTVILVKSLDVTNPLFKTCSKLITEFIQNKLLEESNDSLLWDMNSILKIDSIEKVNLPLYQASNYPDGIYSNFTSFINLKPVYQAMVETNKDGSISSVKKLDGEGKKTKVKNIYALVHKGRAYINTDFGYYPLQKVKNDFYFTGKAKVNAETGDILATSFFFGILGGLIASNDNALFVMKIDHLNGGHIRYKEVK